MTPTVELRIWRQRVGTGTVVHLLITWHDCHVMLPMRQCHVMLPIMLAVVLIVEDVCFIAATPVRA